VSERCRTPLPALNVFMIRIDSTFRKTNGKDGTELQRIIVYCGSSTWGVAAGCLCRERLGERERSLYFHIIHISGNI
jgi:hypothetical protein